MPPQSSQSSAKKSGSGTANGNILSFFKPVAQSQPRTPPPASCTALPASPSPLPPSSPPSRRATPVRLAATEIAASDDDSDGASSDGSLEDLTALLGGRRPGTTAAPSQRRPQHNPYATPRAKRTAVASFHSSPLAIIPKHKFDLKALAKDARQDDATTASSIRARAAAEKAKQDVASASNGEPGDRVLEIVKESGGHDAGKVLRAVQRADPGQSQLRYCFFKAEYARPPSKPAPKEGKKGPWSLVTQGSTTVREQNLAAGVPQTILRKMHNLPDSLLEWILDEICTEKSAIIRQEYCNMIAECPEQIERLLTPERLQQVFLRLGAGEGLSDENSESALSKSGHEPYPGRDWACLLSFLSLLRYISHLMSPSAVEYAVKTLLQMSMDSFLLCNIDAFMEYEAAIQSLADAVPTTSWSSFCYKACLSLYSTVKAQTIRANAVLCLPTSNRRTHELRRRFAVVFLFDDIALARHHPEDVVTIAGVTDLLSGEAFAINSRTDFAELKANIILLDIAVDDGSVIAAFDDREDEKAFNDDVDEAAARLREIWRKINDTGMKLARTEAKSVVEWVQQRLSNQVRTRRKAKKSVFDVPGAAEDPFLPRQQDYMKSFLQKKPRSPLQEDGCIVVLGD